MHIDSFEIRLNLQLFCFNFQTPPLRKFAFDSFFWYLPVFNFVIDSDNKLINKSSWIKCQNGIPKDKIKIWNMKVIFASLQN